MNPDLSCAVFQRINLQDSCCEAECSKECGLKFSCLHSGRGVALKSQHLIGTVAMFYEEKQYGIIETLGR